MNEVVRIMAKDLSWLAGNVIPPIWHQVIRKNKNKVSRSDLLATQILGDILYWYRPTVIRNEETGHVETIKQKFKADMLQKSYKDYEIFFNVPKVMVKNAFDTLENLGLIKRVFRTIDIGTRNQPNTMFIEPNIDKIKEISININTLSKNDPISPPKRTPYHPQNAPHIGTENGGTNTYITTKITTENNISFKDLSLKENGFSEKKPNRSEPFEKKKPFIEEDSSPDQPLTKKELTVIGIFDSCNSYGKPLKTHRKTNKNGEETETYKRTLSAIESLLNTESPEFLIKSRKNFYDFLNSGTYKETHINPDFVLWNPPLMLFFRPDKYLKNSYKKAGFPKIKSLYDEFKPGMYPEIKFARLIPDNFPEITTILQDSLFRANGFTAKDTNILRNAGSKIGGMHKNLTKENQWCYGMSLQTASFAHKLVDFVRGHDFYGKKISPGILASDHLIFDDFYNWIVNEGIIKGKTEKNKKQEYNLYSE